MMDSIGGFGQPSNEPSPDLADSSLQAQSNSQTYARSSCDQCKKMKIKCERQDESCGHCIGRGLKCETTLVKRKKQVKRVNALQEVESRIKRIESVLSASGLAGREAQFADADPVAEQAEPPADLTDKLSMLLMSEEGNSRFLGASSGFSLFSPQGIQWISERTGSNDLSESIARIARKKTSWPASQTEVWHPISPVYREPLPPRHVADHFVERYFNTFNSIFPLYDRKAFYESYELQYLDKPIGGLAWYASLNVVLCFGSMILHDDQDSKQFPYAESKDFREESGWKYFRNATGCFVDLLFRDCNLMAVQAILGMAFIQQITLDPQPFYILIAAACRLAHGIGLHRRLDDFGLSQSEMDQRRNVFWILYFLDKSISLRTGQPSVIVDDDIGVDLPEEKEMFHISPDGSKRYGIFRCHAILARLESSIYQELYSIRARNKSELERLKTVGKLDKELQDWKDSLPLGIRPETPIECPRDQFLPVVMMHFTYLNALTTIHRASVNHGSWVNFRSKQTGSGFHDQHLNPRVYASHSICLSAARSSIELLQRVGIHSPRDNLIWMVMYFPLCGFLVLFSHAIGNPNDPNLASDLKLMDLVTSFLTPSSIPMSPFSTSPSIEVFHELNKIAKRFVDKNYRKNLNKAKRVHEDIDSEQSKWQQPRDKLEVASIQSQADTTPVTNYSTTPTMDTSRTNIFLANALSEPSVHDMQSQQIPQDLQCSQQDFDDFQMDMSGQMSEVSLLPDGDIPFPTTMADMQMFSNNFEWDLNKWWNGYYMPES